MVQEWKEGSNGGAARTMWEALLDIELYNRNMENIDSKTVILVLDLTKLLRNCN